MINTYFGIEKLPFFPENFSLLEHQQIIYDTIKVHTRHGGLCLIMGEPGTGKSVIKESIRALADKYTIVISIARTIHTYLNTVKILCDAFKAKFDGSIFKCEKNLIEEAFNLHRSGKSIFLIIDDAHLMDMENLRRLRLLFEDFPKNSNIILIGQPKLLQKVNLSENSDIKSRVTYSVIIQPLNPDDMRKFILSEFDQVNLPHNILDDDSFDLIVKCSDGIFRKAKNIVLSCLLEAVRAKKRAVSLDMVNHVLLQPHNRIESEPDFLFKLQGGI
jgi:type II secretory pathway predicted ATPase ExeA